MAKLGCAGIWGCEREGAGSGGVGRGKVSKAAEIEARKMERQNESERDREIHQGGREERRSERAKWF